jgi:hypothetical protein
MSDTSPYLLALRIQEHRSTGGVHEHMRSKSSTRAQQEHRRSMGAQEHNRITGAQEEHSGT